MSRSPTKRKRGNRKMIFLKDRYLEAHLDEGPEVEPDRVAAWAIRKGLWQYIPQSPQEVLRRRLSRALRDDYIEDPQGREIRAYHPIVKEVMTQDGLRRHSTWHPIFTTEPGFIRQAFQLRRRAAFSDVAQLSLDFDSYNDNNIFDAELEAFDFDFNKDLEEMRMPTEYPDGLDDREFHEDDDSDEDE